MTAPYSADTIRILVSSDNHVGYAEGDPERTDDSWRTFDEVLSLGRIHDVDMVLLGGDLFHENHPSRKAELDVINSLSEHCQGDKPVALEMIGDQSEHFPGRVNQVNFMNPNLNIAIPVFSIHGNHDDPSGAQHKSALDVLHDAGHLNYYGRIQKIDDIKVKPLLMQKGTTKLALYGISNVRDERLFQTFRDHKVTFFSPSQAKDEWYNILSVHQNHTPHNDTAYLPESSLPSSMDLVIWGHEHKCEIHPRLNPEMGFRVMQPGSTIATSLIEGESEPKQVAILNITGKECKVQAIRLKSVRPFVYRDIILREQPGMKELAQKANNLIQVKKFCKAIIEEMIKEANDGWLASNPDYNAEEDGDPPLPLIRLRVEYTPPEGGEYHVEQNQRFSQEYRDRVANVNDVIQFHKRRKASRRIVGDAEEPDDDYLERNGDMIKVGDLVREHLGVQSLGMLPQNLFSDAVEQVVEKGDKQAVQLFVQDNIKLQVERLVEASTDKDDEERDAGISAIMAQFKMEQEERFRKGEIRARIDAGGLRPRPDDWDSDEHGSWIDYPGARVDAEEQPDAENDPDDVSAPTTAARGARGRGARARGRGGRANAATTARKAPAGEAASKGKRKPFDEDDDEPMLIDSDESADSGGLFVSQDGPATRKSTARTIGARAAPAKSQRTSQNMKQAPLSFVSSGPTASAGARITAARRPAPQAEPSDDEIDDDDDAFEPIVAPPPTRRR